MTDGDSMTINNLRDSANGTFVTLDDYLSLTAFEGLRIVRIRNWVCTVVCGQVAAAKIGAAWAVVSKGQWGRNVLTRGGTTVGLPKFDIFWVSHVEHCEKQEVTSDEEPAKAFFVCWAQQIEDNF